MSDRDAYERNKVKYAAHYKKIFWKRWKDRFGNADRVTQIILAAFTLGLVIVGFLQWRTLDKTDATLKATQRPWIEFDIPPTETLL